MIAWLAVGSAWAVAETCTWSSPVGSVPENGAVDVPLDVAPAVVFTPGECGPDVWTLVLTRTSDGVEVARADQDEVLGDGLAEVFPEATLDPGISYTLTATSESQSVVTFTTGEDVAGEPVGAPSLIAFTASWREEDGFVDLHAEAVPAGDDAAVVAFFDEQEDALRAGSLVPAGEPAVGDWSVALDERPDTWCVTAGQRHVTGEWRAGDPVCAGVEAACGCAAGAPSSAAATLVGLVALVRRRRG
ncbi:MAG: Ig-like domain-containing protein [Myxococcota bacterium]